MTSKLIGGSSTQSRSTRPGTPLTLSRCSGAYEYTDTGRQILAWPLAQYGPLLGYPSLLNPYTADLVSELTSRMARGVLSIGSYPPECEEQLAELLVKRYAEYMCGNHPTVRFFSNGTDACQCAATIARHATGRSGIVSIGYHGGSSPTFSFPPQNGGMVEGKTHHIDFLDYPKQRDVAEVGMSLRHIAAIVIEIPPMVDERDAIDILLMIENDCRLYGMYFILDEIVTGFRYGKAGACEFYSQYDQGGDPIRPDFVCLGKALSTFGKVSAVIGSQIEMSSLADKVFASYTFNDHPFGFHDALLTMQAVDQFSTYRQINEVGTLLKYRLNDMFSRRDFPVECIGHPSRTVLVNHTTSEIYNQFLARMIDVHNILLHRPQFACIAHSLDDVDRTV